MNLYAHNQEANTIDQIEPIPAQLFQQCELGCGEIPLCGVFRITASMESDGNGSYSAPEPVQVVGCVSCITEIGYIFSAETDAGAIKRVLSPIATPADWGNALALNARTSKKVFVVMNCEEAFQEQSLVGAFSTEYDACDHLRNTLEGADEFKDDSNLLQYIEDIGVTIIPVDFPPN